jgi:serine/threonine protein kinase
MPDHVGQQFGNYRLIRRLGEGGFAEVYLGEHIYLKSHAALKLLRVSLSDERTGGFLAEAQTLAGLEHPHIVRVLEFSVEQGTPVLVMEYARGGTLREHYPRGSRIPLADVVAFIQQIAGALQYAHNYGVIHRDVKPENFLLNSKGQLLLSDFGLALLTPSPELLSTQEMAGTIRYVAPEQVRGRPLFASDQYALAIIAYEWLCGRCPFEGNSWEIIQQHLSAAPPSLREMCPEIPAAVEAVLLRALSKNPKDRFAYVQGFAQALQRASQGNKHRIAHGSSHQAADGDHSWIIERYAG